MLDGIETIREIALKCGFKLREQPDGTMDLNPYVYDFAFEIAKLVTMPVAQNISERLRELALEIEAEAKEIQDAE